MRRRELFQVSSHSKITMRAASRVVKRRRVQQLALRGREGALGERVVVRVAGAAHRGQDPGVAEAMAEAKLVCCVPRSL